jgi:hypothetical protein
MKRSAMQDARGPEALIEDIAARVKLPGTPALIALDDDPTGTQMHGTRLATCITKIIIMITNDVIMLLLLLWFVCEFITYAHVIFELLFMLLLCFEFCFLYVHIIT